MPSPKDPKKFAAYCKKMQQIALAKGYGKWMRGKKLSEETIEKMRATQKAIGSAPEERARRSLRAKALGYGKWMAGRPAHPAVIARNRERLGKTYEDIYGQNRARKEAQKRKDGNRKKYDGLCNQHWGWQYTDWRNAVLNRDHHTCQKCGASSEVTPHHIKSWAKYPKLRYEIHNGITLCGQCHAVANAAQARRKWL